MLPDLNLIGSWYKYLMSHSVSLVRHIDFDLSTNSVNDYFLVWFPYSGLC